MTFYTFSAENWRRPRPEVSALMELLLESINRELDDLKRNEVCLRVIGDLSVIPAGPREAMERAIKETEGNQRMTMVLAISYSSRQEIIKAVNKLLDEGARNVNESIFENFLDTAGIPDPDLLIRTSGEFRLSNFLLYQIAYSEIIVSDKFWPDFDRTDLFECIRYYQKRERRFGLISEQVSR